MDLPKIAEFFNDYKSEESNFSNLNLRVDKVVSYVAQSLSDPEHFIWLSVDKDFTVTSFFWGHIMYYVWSDDKIASSVFNVTRKSNRGSLSAYRLLRKFEEWAYSVGAVECHVGAHSGISNNLPANRLLEGTGYSSIGLTFGKRVNHG